MAALLLAGCQKTATLPDNFTQLDKQVELYPDYTDIVVPPNIAPLNFMLRDSAATSFVVQMKGSKAGELLAAADDRNAVSLDSTSWRSLLQANKGADIEVSIFAQKEGKWVRYKSHRLTVAEEDIDPFLSYRLIEPGYELYRQLGLYQRNLTNWDVHTIYENNRSYKDDENHCINCHNYRMGDARDMLFHVRANHGGTIFVQDGKARKVQLKDSTIITSGVYPSWHPQDNLVAFSTNHTGQTFHLFHQEKIEVLDSQSDLFLYDVSANEITHIIRTRCDLETFPCWAPSGDKLYYCRAKATQFLDTSYPDSTFGSQLSYKYDSLRYDIMAMDFDRKTRSFGQPEVVVDASSIQRSASVPRISPDGRYVLFTMGNYGQFHIWHKSADLWVKDLQNNNTYNLTEANSPVEDSFHSWSSNGRWISFSSRRMDKNYTRTFLAYFDKNGQAHKAFVIPQEDPEMNILLLKSFNVPELTRNAVEISQDDLRRCIYDTEGDQATYRRTKASQRLQMEGSTDAQTGASKQADGQTGATKKAN